MPAITILLEMPTWDYCESAVTLLPPKLTRSKNLGILSCDDFAPHLVLNGSSVRIMVLGGGQSYQSNMRIKLVGCTPHPDDNEQAGTRWGDVTVDYNYHELVDFMDEYDNLLLRVDPNELKAIIQAIWVEDEEGWQRELLEQIIRK